MRFLPALLVLAALSAAAAPAGADWPNDGLPVCTATAPQLRPMLAPDGNGGAFIAWVDFRPDAGFYVQRVLSGGQVAPGWPANGLWLSIPHFALSAPDVAGDGSGKAYVCWGGNQVVTGYGVYLQAVTAHGSIVSGWPPGGLLVAATDFLRLARVIGDGNGGAIMTWNDASSLLLQRVTATGATAAGWPAGGRRLTLDADPYTVTRLVSDGAGGAIVVWRYSGIEGGDVYVERVDGGGARPPLWPAAGLVMGGGSAEQGGPNLVSDGSGGAIIAWYDDRNAGSTGRDIYAQHVRANGALDPNWPAGGLAVCTAPGEQTDIGLCSDGAGGAIIVWVDRRSDPNGDVYALRVTAQGGIAPGWLAQGVVVCDAAGSQLLDLDPVVSDGAGGALIAWEDARAPVTGKDIYVHHILGDGSTAAGWPEGGVALCDMTGPQGFVNAIPNGLGGAIVAWEDARGGVNTHDIYAARINPDGSTPVLLALVSAEATADRVRLRWHDAGGMVLAADVGRRTDSSEWNPVGRVAADASGDLVFEDRNVVPGMRYAYRLTVASESYGEVWVEVPGAASALGLSIVAPASGASLRLALTLPSTSPATIDLFDLRGRRLLSRAIEGTAGTQVIDIGTREPLAAGVYLARLSQDDRFVVAKGMVVR
jgi:hypothetical protein